MLALLLQPTLVGEAFLCPFCRSVPGALNVHWWPGGEQGQAMCVVLVSLGLFCVPPYSVQCPGDFFVNWVVLGSHRPL